MWRRASALTAAVLALWGAGCLGDDSDPDEDRARAAVEAYLVALGESDTGAICSLLSEKELADLDSAGSCAEIFDQGFALLEENGVEVPEYRVVEISVEGNSAEATISAGGEDEEIPLVSEGGEWKLTGTTSFGQFHPDDPLPGGPPN